MKKLELRAEFDGAQDYDLVLRAAAGIWKDADRIHLGTDAEFVHIPKVLYHWRCHRDSTASNPESKRYAYEAGKRALEELAANLGWKVKVEHTRHLGFYRCEFEPSALVQRTDVGALASPMPSRSGKFISGIYDICRTGEASRLIDDEKTDCEKLSSEDISMRYAGLRNGFGGYLHRAELTQDVEIADVRTLQVRPEYEKDLQEAMEQIRSGADPVRTSVAFCQKIRNDGRRILWIPFK